jgi:hypothetical protein
VVCSSLGLKYCNKILKTRLEGDAEVIRQCATERELADDDDDDDGRAGTARGMKSARAK